MNNPLPTDEIANVVENLPAAPRILAELAPRLQQTDVHLEDVAALIRRDAGLTARLIAAANSAAYVGAEPSVSLEEAVARIGYRETFRILGAVASAQLADPPLRLYGVSTQRLRENALFVALMMEELAPSAGLEPRAAYTIGLFRSLGKVVLNQVASNRGDVPSYGEATVPVADWESAMLAYTNPAIGAAVLNHWHFPAETSEAIRDHYVPPPSSSAATHLLNLAAGAAELRDFGFPGESSYWQFAPENFAATRIDEGKLVWAGERAHRTLGRISSALA